MGILKAFGRSQISTGDSSVSPHSISLGASVAFRFEIPKGERRRSWRTGGAWWEALPPLCLSSLHLPSSPAHVPAKAPRSPAWISTSVTASNAEAARTRLPTVFRTLVLFLHLNYTSPKTGCAFPRLPLCTGRGLASDARRGSAYTCFFKEL